MSDNITESTVNLKKTIERLSKKRQLRDDIAIAAMQASITSSVTLGKHKNDFSPDTVAKFAYYMADVMMEQRGK